MQSPYLIRSEIVEVGKRLAERQLVTGTQGNISVRLEEGRFLITPRGFDKGGLKAEDLLIVDGTGKKLQGRGEPSSEMAMHLYVFSHRADIRACVHAHPPHATAFAVAGIELPIDLLPESMLLLGKVPLTDYATPGTADLPRSLEPWIENHQLFLLRNHGLLAIGETLTEALHRMETAEHLARVAILAHQLGSINRLPSDELERLERLRRRTESAWQDKKS